MKLFIWQHEDDITDHWHREAGIAVIASSKEEAQTLIQKDSPDWKPTSPNFESEIPDQEVRKFIFPDAGCC